MMRLIILISVVLLSACAALPKGNETHVLLAPGVTMNLPSITEFEGSVEALQLITARHGDRTIVFQDRFSLSPGHGLIVGIDPIGRAALTITLTPDGITYDKADFLPTALKPENVLADIMIAGWPEESIRRSISCASLVVSKNTRRIVKDGQDIIRIEYLSGDHWSGRMRYSNKTAGYTLDIQSVEAAP